MVFNASVRRALRTTLAPVWRVFQSAYTASKREAVLVTAPLQRELRSPGSTGDDQTSPSVRCTIITTYRTDTRTSSCDEHNLVLKTRDVEDGHFTGQDAVVGEEDARER
jgi:hypothetical protein